MSDIPVTTSLTPEGKRLASLDVLRGIAILGILPMNILTFAAPFAAYGNPSIYFENTPLNFWIHGVIHVLFDMKMMALFSLLFGAGIAIYDSKSWRGGEDRTAKVRWLWVRRSLWLMAFGLAHMFFIWEGDIIFAYGLTALVAVWWCRRVPTKWLWPLMAGVLLMHFVLIAGLGYLGTFQPVPGENAPQSQIDAYEQQTAFYNPSPAYIAEMEEVHRGGYAELFEHRADLVVMIQFIFFPIFMFWRAAALMLLGILLVRNGVLIGERSPRFYILMAVAGYAIGVPIVLWGLWLNSSRGWDPSFFNFPGQIPNIVGSVAVMLGHAGVLLFVVKSGLLKRVTGVLSKVGRMAFTNYLTQSIICAIIFYGYGFGMYGHMNRAELLLTVLIIWALQIAWSNAWLAVFRFGPFEWLWRSLTYMKPQPMRLQSSP